MVFGLKGEKAIAQWNRFSCLSVAVGREKAGLSGTFELIPQALRNYWICLSGICDTQAESY